MFKRETLKNKVYATILMTAGVVPMFIDGDATFLLFGGAIALPLFFAKENWMYWNERV